MIFIGDTTVTLDPTAEELAEIALPGGRSATTYFEIEPQVAMLSYSQLRLQRDKTRSRCRKAVEIARERWPDLVVDGEMQADTAVDPASPRRPTRSPAIQGDANVLICPDLESANIAYKLLWRLGKVRRSGPSSARHQRGR